MTDEPFDPDAAPGAAQGARDTPGNADCPAPDAAATSEEVPATQSGETSPTTSVAGPPTPSNADLAELVEGVGAQLRDFSSRSEFYEDMIRQLQSRVETLQSEQVQQLLGPVFQKLAILLTQAESSAVAAREQDEGYRAEVEFEYFGDALVETLDVMGAASVEAKVGDAFDRSLHASRKNVPTPDADKDWTLAKVLRQGIVRIGAERAFVPAQVAVFRYDGTPSLSPGADATPQAPGEGAPSPQVTTTHTQLNQEGHLS